MTGIANQGAVLAAVSGRKCFSCVFECVVMSKKNIAWLASWLGSVELVDSNQLDFTYSTEEITADVKTRTLVA